jgi:hypothetical protein
MNIDDFNALLESEASITLTNPLKPDVAEVAVAHPDYDPEFPFLCLPQNIADALGLVQVDVKYLLDDADDEDEDAEAEAQPYPYVGPVQVMLAGKPAFCGAVVRGDRVVVGALAVLDLSMSTTDGHEQYLSLPDLADLEDADIEQIQEEFSKLLRK